MSRNEYRSREQRQNDLDFHDGFEWVKEQSGEVDAKLGHLGMIINPSVSKPFMRGVEAGLEGRAYGSYSSSTCSGSGCYSDNSSRYSCDPCNRTGGIILAIAGGIIAAVFYAGITHDSERTKQQQAPKRDPRYFSKIDNFRIDLGEFLYDGNTDPKIMAQRMKHVWDIASKHGSAGNLDYQLTALAIGGEFAEFPPTPQENFLFWTTKESNALEVDYRRNMRLDYCLRLAEKSLLDASKSKCKDSHREGWNKALTSYVSAPLTILETENVDSLQKRLGHIVVLANRASDNHLQDFSSDAVKIIVDYSSTTIPSSSPDIERVSLAVDYSRRLLSERKQ
jgi:hypothetical protein